MHEIANYKTIEKICENQICKIYRGQGQQSSLLCFIKIANPDPVGLIHLKAEYQKLADFTLDYIVKVNDVKDLSDGILLIATDFEAISLEDFQKQKLTIEGTLEIIIALATALAELHTHGIVHKVITPQNILLDRVKKVAKLSNFGLWELSEEIMLHSVSYISPEQTGRMNRSIDYRSDIYSLGAVFYEMLVGEKPFTGESPMEIIHGHIAKKVTYPSEINGKIPTMLSDIIVKMLAKTAEERYQSGHGLKKDLQICLEQLQTRGEIFHFTPGSKDINDGLYISEKLYGRQEQLKVLQETFYEVCQGQTEILFFSGPSGIGKSALVCELQKLVVEQNGYFLTGKYDVQQQGTPYSAIAQAFTGLIKHLLTEPEENLLQWKNQIKKALGENSQIVANLIPNLKYIIGELESEVETKLAHPDRFNLVFQEFFDVFLQAPYPLVLFLDDLQWIDHASLDLLKQLFTTYDLPQFLFIGAYRTEQVTSSHPFILAVEEIKKTREIKKAKGIKNIELKALSEENIQQFLVDSLQCSVADTGSLAALLYQKTAGNPFFIKEFLKSLYQKKLLYHDAIHGKQWHLEKIKDLQVSSNVAELMVKKIASLEKANKRVLQIAACIGNIFSLSLLADVYGKSLEQTMLDSSKVIANGFIRILQDNGSFVHDKVQEACYESLTEEETNKIHLHIGQTLLKKITEAELFEKIFTIVDQINYGHYLLCEDREKHQTANLNLIAAKKAKTTNAYSSAAKYLQIGLSLLPEDAWEKYPQLSLETYTELGECAYLLGKTSRSEQLLDIAYKNSRLIQKTEIHSLKTILYGTSSKYEKAVVCGLKGLELLGFYVPLVPGKMDIIKEVMEIKWRLRGKDISSLSNRSSLTDPRYLAIVNLLLNVQIPANMSGNDELFILIALKIVNISLKYGHSNGSPTAYINYGMMQGMPAIYEFGKLGLKLGERFPVFAYKQNFLFANFINHWRNHLKTTIEFYEKSVKESANAGDLNFIAYNKFGIVAVMIAKGDSLEKTAQYLEKNLKFIEKYPEMEKMCRLYEKLVANLRGTPKNSKEKKDILMDDREIAHMQEENPYIYTYYLIKLELSYFFENYKNAINVAIDAEKNAEKMFLTHINLSEYYFYYCLTVTSLYRQFSKKEKKKYKKFLLLNREKFRNWAKNCPQNFQHKYLLLCAEMAHLSGSFTAMKLYDQAIEFAQANEFMQYEALSNELAAKYYLEHGHLTIATAYMTKARYAYLKWGAIAKVKDLEEKYPQIFTTTLNIQAASPISSSLDFQSILEIFQHFSQEIVFSRLIDKLVRIVIENTGAQKGLLVLEREKGLVVEAQGVVEGNQIHISLVDKAPRNFPQTIINYTKRTCQELVIANVEEENIFANDPYIVNSNPKSILCYPILKQRAFIGAFYLENKHIQDAFADERLQILEVICAQASISLENARLYKQMQQLNARLEKENRKRTKIQQGLTQSNMRLEKTLSQLYKTQEQIIQQERLRALGEMVSGVAHDFKNLLSPILGFNDMLLVCSHLLDDRETTKSYLKMINIAARDATVLVERMEELYRLQPEMIMESFDLYDLVEKCIALTQPKWKNQTQAKNIYVYLETNLQKELFILGNPSETREMLTNLIFNAVDAMPDGGKISIQTYAQNPYAILEVKDNGMGMDKKIQEKCLEPFFSTKEDKGTGMGLAMVSNIVKRHKGILNIESKSGEGTKFTISLPLHAKTEQITAKEELILIEPFHVLLVENEPLVREVLVAFLNVYGCSFEIAEDGEEGLQRFYPGKFDLVITDQSMPQISGNQLAIKIKELSPHTPVILLSGFDSMPKIDDMTWAVDFFLAKPVTISKLNRILAKLQEDQR